MTLSVVLIGIGANLPGYQHKTPKSTCAAAVKALAAEGFRIRKQSRWYRSSPVPPSDQPWYVNGVVEAETDLDPPAALAALHRIEARFGRKRRQSGEARVLDLDLLAMGDLVTGPSDPVQIPHPRMNERAFVIIPLGEICPDWVDPRSGLDLAFLRARLAADQVAEPLAGDEAG